MYSLISVVRKVSVGNDAKIKTPDHIKRVRTLRVTIKKNVVTDILVAIIVKLNQKESKSTKKQTKKRYITSIKHFRSNYHAN